MLRFDLQCYVFMLRKSNLTGMHHAKLEHVSMEIVCNNIN